MLSKFILLSTLMSSPFCFAEDFHLMDAKAIDLTSFAAPVVPSTSAVNDKMVGQIIYDASSNQFKGLDSAGNWDAMSAGTGSNSVISGGTERIERATITGNATTPTVASQSGSWVGSVSRIATGRYVITPAAGMFSAAPSCECRCKDNGAPVICEFVTSTTSTAIETTCANAGGATDVDREVICMGPR